jgi:anti-sigma B factor antagonist
MTVDHLLEGLHPDRALPLKEGRSKHSAGRKVSVTSLGQPAETRVDAEFDDPLVVSSRTAEDGTVIVAAVGEVDAFTAALLRSVLDAQLVRQPPELVLDLSGIRFLGSAGLAVLVETQKAASVRDVPLRLIATNRAVTRPLEVTGLIDLFTVSGDGG